MDVVVDELFYFAQVPVESFFQEIQAKAQDLLLSNFWRHGKFIRIGRHVNERWSFVKNGLLERAADISWLLYAQGVDSHSLGNLGKVEVLEIGAEIRNPATIISSFTMPRVLLLKTTILIGRSYWARVRSPINMPRPSPQKATTCLWGYGNCAPIACGSALAIEP